MSLPLNQPVRLAILSQPSHLRVVRSALEKMCELAGFDNAQTGRIVLSVDEALSNIVRHAYEGAADGRIEIELTPHGQQTVQGLRISLRDYGRHADPADIHSRELTDVRPGGLGVHIISQCMDCVQYHKADGGGTLLVMEKRCANSEP